MKKMFLMAMMALVMCGLAACSSSDDENGGQPVDLSATVGTWVCTASQDWWDTENGSGSATDAMKGEGAKGSGTSVPFDYSFEKKK